VIFFGRKSKIVKPAKIFKLVQIFSGRLLRINRGAWYLYWRNAEMRSYNSFTALMICDILDIIIDIAEFIVTLQLPQNPA
jgi:hypothetical protein